MSLRMIIIVAGAAALALVLAVAKAADARADRLQVLVDGHAACLAAVAGKPKARPPAEVCPLAIASADAIADRAVACDAALAKSNTFGAGSSCSTPVKTVIAQRDAARRERDGLALDLKNQRASQAAALASAERRGRLDAERKARAQAAVIGAPRDGDGLSVFDAERMRARWGAGAGADARQP